MHKPDFVTNESFLMAASRGDLGGLSSALLKGADPNTVDSMLDQPALVLAIQSGSVDCVMKLIQAGAGMECKGHDRRTALHWAVIDQEPDIIHILLDAGADIEARDVDGMTPFLMLSHHELSMYGNQWHACVDALISCGADRFACEPNGASALHLSADAGDWERMETFLDLGLDCNARTKSGKSVMDVAIESRAEDNEACVLILLQKGVAAPVYAPNTDIAHLPFLEYARSIGWNKVVAYLECEALNESLETKKATREYGLGL